jgi:hypothetical protein
MAPLSVWASPHDRKGVGGLYQRHRVMWDLAVSCGIPSQSWTEESHLTGLCEMSIYWSEGELRFTKKVCHDHVR